MNRIVIVLANETSAILTMQLLTGTSPRGARSQSITSVTPCRDRTSSSSSSSSTGKTFFKIIDNLKWPHALFLGFYPEDGLRMQQFNAVLVELISKGMQPLSLVSEPSFRKLVQLLDPLISLPSRFTLTKSLLPYHFNLAVDKLKKELNEVDHVPFTTDLWTSRTMESFMTVTVHFITIKMKRPLGGRGGA